MATKKLPSSSITNTASIGYNNQPPVETCPQTTKVYPDLEVVKRAFTCQDGMITGIDTEAGTVGEDRIITYELLLINASDKPFTNVSITDTINLSSDKFVIISSSETPIPSATPNADPNKTDITFNTVADVAGPSVKSITYTIQLDREYTADTPFQNTAGVKYYENPTNSLNPDFDATQPESPYNAKYIVDGVNESNTVEVALKTSKVNTGKIAPESVLCGETFEYKIYVQSENKPVTNLIITDTLPQGFTKDTIKVQKGAMTADGTISSPNDLTVDVEYTETMTGNDLTIETKDGGLDLTDGEGILVIITGSYTYPTPPTP